MTRGLRPVLLALGISVLLSLSGCKERVPLPAQFEGTYVTSDDKYAGRYVSLTPSEVTIGVGDDREERHAIRAVYTKTEAGELVYEVVYRTDYGTDSLRFAEGRDGEISLNHPAEVRWVRGERR
jgi:hypothetical protein